MKKFIYSDFLFVFGVYSNKHMIPLWDFYDLIYFYYNINSLKKKGQFWLQENMKINKPRP